MQLLARNTVIYTLILIASAALNGCGGSSSSEQIDQDLLTFAEPLPASQSETAGANTQPVELALKLKPGSRFPLHKTVQQELTQSSPGGVKKSTSQLELMMAITVEEVKDFDRKFGVNYTRVKYSQHFDNQHLTFDSDTPATDPPPDVRPYQGMVNHGFTFWVGRDNQIKEILGFNEFLQHCLVGVAEVDRNQIIKQIAMSSQHDGLANFIDDTIGLLPYDEEQAHKGAIVKVGHTWKRRRYQNQPLPFTVEHTYSVREIDSKTATLDILGDVLPTAGISDEIYEGMKIQIRGGHSHGQCDIDLATGLPTNSQLDQYIDMAVSLEEGVTFEQRKHILTTVRAYPQQQDDQVQQAGFSR